MTNEKKQRQHNDPAVCLHVPQALLDELDRCAAAQNYTRSELLRELIRRHVYNMPKPSKTAKRMNFNPNASK